jgi:hypothetical protein
MKFRVVFKTPDALHDAVKDALGDEDEDDDEDESEDGPTAKSLISFAERWVRWGEYVTVEFDTVAGTATVVPNGR